MSGHGCESVSCGAASPARTGLVTDDAGAELAAPADHRIVDANRLTRTYFGTDMTIRRHLSRISNLAATDDRYRFGPRCALVGRFVLRPDEAVGLDTVEGVPRVYLILLQIRLEGEHVICHLAGHHLGGRSDAGAAEVTGAHELPCLFCWVVESNGE